MQNHRNDNATPVLGLLPWSPTGSIGKATTCLTSPGASAEVIRNTEIVLNWQVSLDGGPWLDVGSAVQPSGFPLGRSSLRPFPFNPITMQNLQLLRKVGLHLPVPSGFPRELE